MKTQWTFVAILVLTRVLVTLSQTEIAIDSSAERVYKILGGNAAIVSVSSLTRSSDKGSCDIVTSEVEALEAIRWTLKRLNDKNFIPGIKLGLVAIDSCSDSKKAVDSTLRVLREFEDGKCPYGMGENCKAFGILGPERSSHAKPIASVLGTLPPSLQYMQISYKATAKELSDSMKYPNFFRVVPTDNLQVAAITQLLVSLKSNYFAIVYENDTYGEGAAFDLKQKAEENGLCVSAFEKIEQDSPSQDLRRVAQYFIFRIRTINCIVFIGSPIIANDLLKHFSGEDKKLQTAHLNFIFLDAIGLQSKYMKIDGKSSSQSIDIALGALALTPPYQEIKEFTEHWESMYQNLTKLHRESQENPFLIHNQKLEESWQPLVENESKTTFKQNVFVRYAIEAAYSLAYLFKDIHWTLCRSNTMCISLLNKTSFAFGEHMSKINTIDLSSLGLSESLDILRFNADGDRNYSVGSVKYEVFNYRECHNKTHCFKKIASYQDGTLIPRGFPSTMSSYTYDYDNNIWVQQTEYPPSQCPIGTICDECISKDLPDAYYYRNGDYIIVGVAPIYTAPTDSSKCGELYDTTGASLGEAIAYAVKDVQEKRGQFSTIFPGKTLGFIIINSCNRGVIVQEKIFSIINGQSPLGDIRHKLIGFIGELGSIISLAMSNPITELKYVQVGYGSTSSMLSDRSVHPYFMRVCTSDDKQAETMVQVIIQMDVNYIQVVFQNEAYGRGGNQSIARAIAKAGKKICVARVHEVSESDNFNTVLTHLRENSYAKVVVVFLRHSVMGVALVAFNNMQAGEFLIFGSEGWGKRPHILGNNPKLIGSLTTSVEMAFDRNFDDYMSRLRPQLTNENPWLLDILEKRMNCYYPQSFNKGGAKKECDQNKGYTDTPRYLQDTWVPFVIRAVQALCIGVSKSINIRCGGTSYCDVLRNDPTIITTEMKKIKFDLFASGDQKYLFDSNGDGNVGYKIYNIHRANGISKYEDVGQWSVDHFTFRAEKMVYPGEKESIQSTCPNQATCDICFGKSDCQATDTCDDGPLNQQTGMNPAIVYSLIGLCNVFAAAFVVLAIIVCYHHIKRKRKRESAKYLHAIPTGGDSGNIEMYSDPDNTRTGAVIGTVSTPRIAQRGQPQVRDGSSGGSAGSANRRDADGGLW